MTHINSELFISFEGNPLLWIVHNADFFPGPCLHGEHGTNALLFPRPWGEMRTVTCDLEGILDFFGNIKKVKFVQIR